ncbi:hypothetical protein FIBSPDRAFT_1043370 [Athelia psychrophila]|uniref:FUN34 transmembrane protein n=1 Tax=Athelia psychrophila TaxID=1759441 RepID=A0A166LBS7_9AGAM|nr:hypothetical protein FIBSPDRAFT_1043370 [Fibularhizoctonia sp. CBS 109695]
MSTSSATNDKAYNDHFEGDATAPRCANCLGHTAPLPDPPVQRKLANPAPLGLFSFGTGFLLSGLLTLHTRGVVVPNIVIVLLLFYGGICQFLVGIVEMFCGNTFGFTVFCSYGAFNLSYGGIFLPQLGIAAAYTVDGVVSPEFSQAIGLYLWSWFVVTMLFIFGALRSNGAVLSTLVFTALALATLGMSEFTGADPVRIAGGVFSICAALCAYWGAVSGFYGKDGAGATFHSWNVPSVSLGYSQV